MWDKVTLVLLLSGLMLLWLFPIQLMSQQYPQTQHLCESESKVEESSNSLLLNCPWNLKVGLSYVPLFQLNHILYVPCHMEKRTWFYRTENLCSTTIFCLSFIKNTGAPEVWSDCNFDHIWINSASGLHWIKMYFISQDVTHLYSEVFVIDSKCSWSLARFKTVITLSHCSFLYFMNFQWGKLFGCFALKLWKQV